jgi:glycerophosphoryl diester phosphodiesterase
MSTTRTLGRAGLAAVVFAALTPAIVVNAAHDRQRAGPQLTGRAVLPVETYAPGPPSGAFFGNVVTNGIQFPLASQPVEGFSGIVEGRFPGQYLAMPDNGFGNKANSADFLIRAYYIDPDFKTKRGGSGSVDVGEFISFRDPWGVIGFPITNEGTSERLLTGADIDPESIQRGRHGDLWVGDEFGPWILHFDDRGRLLEPPIAMPDGLQSPSNPHLGTATPTVNGSRGIEAMAISPNGRWLTVVLEGAVPGDDPFSRRIYQYNTRNGTFTRLADYRVEVDTHFVSDAQALDNHRLVVIERDGGRGLSALFRSVYKVDLSRTGGTGAVVKTQLVDLAAIPDPDLISLPPIHEGDVGLGDPFRVTCESIEAVHVVSHGRLLLGCDNNFPNTGRNPTLADDNEFILVRTPGL